jgi:uncharacterized protein
LSTNRVIEVIEQSAFKQAVDHVVNLPSLIHAFAGGSALHGASLPGKADLDVYGVFMEPRINVFGLTRYDHFVTSTSGDNKRNSPDDVDITLYSLRRWAALAVKGNPTALSFLFAKNEAAVEWDCVDVSLWGQYKDALREAVVCKKSINAFRGFVSDQMKRLLGEKGQGKHGQRPDLALTHGYDTKAAMHAVRLLGEAVDLLQTGHIEYPRYNVVLLRQIREGKFSLDGINSFVSGLFRELDEAEKESELQETPNYDAVNSILVDAYSEQYS